MPAITSITPATFDAGRSVTLSGSGFGSSQGQVLIGGVAQNVNTWNDTAITFTTVRGSQSQGACRVDVVSASLSSESWWLETLSSGLTSVTKDESHGTVTWNAAGYADFSYTSQGITDVHVTVPTGNTQIVVEYEIRRSTANSTKQLKIFSRDAGGAGALTAFMAASYSGGRPIFTYSDNSNSGDNDCEINLAGAFRGGTLPTRTPAFTKAVSQANDTTVLQDTSGTAWEKWRVFAKWNDDNTANGELAAWKDGVLVAHLTDMWNCATTTGDGVNPGVTEGQRTLYQQRGQVALGAYANVGGFSEQYRNFKIGFFKPAELVGGIGTSPNFTEDFESYADVAAAVAGPWYVDDTALGGSHAITSFGGSKRYTTTWTLNESRTLLYYRIPGAVPGDDSTGKTYLKLQWDEYRDAAWDFQADKSCRLVGRLANGNVSLDVLLGLTGTGTPGNSTQAIVFGQGLGNDLNFVVDSSWNMARQQWYTIAVEVQLNTVGQADGWIKLWRDGVLRGSATNINIRGKPATAPNNTYTFHEFAVGGWESGGAPVASETRYIDNVQAWYY